MADTDELFGDMHWEGIKGPIKQLQLRHRSWEFSNFPRHSPENCIFGMMEELGELTHAWLKHEQGIREYDEDKLEGEVEDAVGDIFFYMLALCNNVGLDFYQLLRSTAQIVWARDWIKFPKNGVSE